MKKTIIAAALVAALVASVRPAGAVTLADCIMMLLGIPVGCHAHPQDGGGTGTGIDE